MLAIRMMQPHAHFDNWRNLYRTSVTVASQTIVRSRAPLFQPMLLFIVSQFTRRECVCLDITVFVYILHGLHTKNAAAFFALGIFSCSRLFRLKGFQHPIFGRFRATISSSQLTNILLTSHVCTFILYIQLPNECHRLCRQLVNCMGRLEIMNRWLRHLLI